MNKTSIEIVKAVAEGVQETCIRLLKLNKPAPRGDNQPEKEEHGKIE